MTDPIFLEEIQKFRARIEHGHTSDERKITKLYQLFTILITRLTNETKIQFTSLFARLSYIVAAYKLKYKEAFILHSFRRNSTNSTLSKDILLGQVAIDILLSHCFNQDIQIDKINELYTSLNENKDQKKSKFEKIVKVQLKSIDLNSKRIEAQIVEEPFSIISIAYDRPDRNEDYTDLISQLERYNLLPLLANLIDIEIDEEHVYYPSSIVFEPDYLYDVTSISECFGAFANHQAGYLLRKFLPKASSKAILIGNLSNFFLDQLIYKPHSNFEDFIGLIFAQDPLGIALLSDQDVRESLVLLERHFDHIKDVVLKKLPQINVHSESCHVEPSFYSAKYGIQGRLDLFSVDDGGASIIELKSGSTYRPNSYGLSNNHYHQTLLYDLLIESVYGSNLKRSNFILYSKATTNQLRFAPALKVEQREALKERNQLYIHDRVLLAHKDFISYFQDYARKNSSYIKGFLKTDYSSFLKYFSALDKVEKKYANLLFQFTLRELLISKLGNEGSEKSNGLASLWMQNIELKKEQFNILNHMTVHENKTDQEEPILILEISDKSAKLSNFRIGDLGILYPDKNSKDAILRHQVFKVTILSLEQKNISVRLRSRQENSSLFENYQYWHIEHDSLENGFYEMSRSIYEFARAPKIYREMMLCRRPPETYKFTPVDCGHHLTTEQKGIFSEIIKSKEYYLLWGPPGTGKTSVMLREIAHHFIEHENDRVLFLAYTNRAVDEICEALYSLKTRPSFIRIGSRYSTGEKFHSHLLENQIKGIKNRKSLKNRLSGERVFVGTVASVVGRLNLFNLIKFDLAVIDEASQILETSLIGLLSRVRKFILIGDHLQLPAIVQQESDSSQIDDNELRDLGMKQLSSSLFERMYKTAVQNGWEHAVGQLSHQGRMHIDIMSFVNDHFYNGKLRALDTIDRLSALSFYHRESASKMNRIIYHESPVDLDSDSIKINEHESRIVSLICEQLLTKYRKSNKGPKESSIGIITPYRAQIASIRSYLNKLEIPEIDLITIDTVERYQGGSRDIIIMSCCMNYGFQLNALVSLSEEGIDRKLNVAITRAKEQFILVGNRAILSQNAIYRSLIERSAKEDSTLIAKN